MFGAPSGAPLGAFAPPAHQSALQIFNAWTAGWVATHAPLLAGPLIGPADWLAGTVHGSRTTVSLQATVDSAAGGYLPHPAGNLIPGGTFSTGPYIGRGPEDDVRVGWSWTAGAIAGRDLSAGGSLTVYDGTTDNVRGYSQQAQLGGFGPWSGTLGRTMSGATDFRGDHGVSFASLGYGPGVGQTYHAGRTLTGAVDMRLPMTPGAVVVSNAAAYDRATMENIIHYFRGD